METNNKLLSRIAIIIVTLKKWYMFIPFLLVPICTYSQGKNDNKYKLIDTLINNDSPIKRIKITLTDTIPSKPNGTIWVGFADDILVRTLTDSLRNYVKQYFGDISFKIAFAGWELRNSKATITISPDIGFDKYIFLDSLTSVYFTDEAINSCLNCSRTPIKSNIDSLTLLQLDSLSKAENYFKVKASIILEGDVYVYKWVDGIFGHLQEYYQGHRIFTDGKADFRCFIFFSSPQKDSIRTILEMTNLFVDQRYYVGNYVLYDKLSSSNNHTNILGFKLFPDQYREIMKKMKIQNLRFSRHNNMSDKSFETRMILLEDYFLE